MEAFSIAEECHCNPFPRGESKAFLSQEATEQQPQSPAEQQWCEEATVPTVGFLTNCRSDYLRNLGNYGKRTAVGLTLHSCLGMETTLQNGFLLYYIILVFLICCFSYFFLDITLPAKRAIQK